MAWYDSLIGEGYVPAGAHPKAVVEPGGDPGYYQTDPLSTALREFTKFRQEQKAEQERLQKAVEKKADMYKTLRESGYEPNRAYDAVNNLKFPEGPGGETKGDLETKKTKAEITKIETETEYIPVKNAPKLQSKILQKIANNEPLTAGEQKIYDETIKHKGDTLETYLTDKDKEQHVSTRERILNKVANNEPLTAGEEKLYQDVFSKTATELDKITTKAEETGKEAYVPMLKPNGTPTRVHKDDVAKALKKGYKRR